MPGAAAKIRMSEKPLVVLEVPSRSRTVGKGLAQRARIIVPGFQGLLNQEIAVEAGLNRQPVGVWRQRWRAAWDALCVWAGTEPRRQLHCGGRPGISTAPVHHLRQHHDGPPLPWSGPAPANPCKNTAAPTSSRHTAAANHEINTTHETSPQLMTL